MNRLLSLLAAFGLVIGVATAGEYTGSIKAVVPFDFKIGATVIPSGEYFIDKDGRAGVLAVRSLRTGVYFKFFTQPMRTENSTGTPKLVFNTNGDQHYLAEVWMPGRAEGVSVIKSRAEREAFGRSAVKSVVLIAR